MCFKKKNPKKLNRFELSVLTGKKCRRKYTQLSLLHKFFTVVMFFQSFISLIFSGFLLKVLQNVSTQISVFGNFAESILDEVFIDDNFFTRVVFRNFKHEVFKQTCHNGM